MNDSYVEQIQPRNVRIIGGLEALSTGGSSSYTTRIDTVSTTGMTYIGKAAPGSGVGSASWQIQRIDETQTPETTVILWADGDADFNNVWSDRVSLSYS